MNTHTLFQQAGAKRASVFAAAWLALSVSASAFAAEAGPEVAAVKPALSCAEVIADLNLWRRAGAEQFAEQAHYYQLDQAAYEQAVAEYRRLRSGPAFAQEVAKVLANGQAAAHADAR